MHKSVLWAAMAFAFAMNVQAADNFTDNRHVKLGISCEMCHGKDNAVPYPTIEQCKNCHDPKQVAEKTKEVKP